jgi:hypothetical protein
VLDGRRETENLVRFHGNGSFLRDFRRRSTSRRALPCQGNTKQKEDSVLPQSLWSKSPASSPSLFSMTSDLPSPHSSVGKPDMQSSAGDISFNCGFNSQLGIENTDAFDCWGFNSHDSTLSLVFSTNYNEDIKVATLISNIP